MKWHVEWHEQTGELVIVAPGRRLPWRELATLEYSGGDAERIGVLMASAPQLANVAGRAATLPCTCSDQHHCLACDAKDALVLTERDAVTIPASGQGAR